MIRTLHDGWTLSAIDPDPSTAAGGLPDLVPATVPGTVHTDLLAAGLIDDPYLGLNESRTAWIGHTRWSYRMLFEWTPVGFERSAVVFEGIDTVATVLLNGIEIGRTANQHRTYRFEVARLLRGGQNELEVRFDSAWERAHDTEEQLGSLPNAYPTPFNFIRKMAANFGWDWGPQLVTAGLWKAVKLEEWSGARLSSVRPHVAFDGSARLAIDVDVERASNQGPLAVQVGVCGVTVELVIAEGARSASLPFVEVPGAEPWWPHDLGAQPLYPLQVTLSAGSEALDSWRRRIGFRTATLDTAEDDSGSAFTIGINGVPVFVRGANWIPDDCFLPRVSRGRYRERIEQAVGANLSLLRVWGGGIYETDDFYELCDELGVMVWQDFLFACAAYPEESLIADEVIAEAKDNVARLTGHPSLVLWNGCNENIWGYFDWDWQGSVEGRTWGAGYYLEILPEIVRLLAPDVPYWPGSPYSGTMDIHPNEPSRGNMHIWDVWNKVDYSEYATYRPRFVSEFGFQGPPTWSTVDRSIPADSRAPDSPAMMLHQKAEDGNEKLRRGMAPHLPEPRTTDDWLYLSQLNQARAIGFAIEHFRSLRGHCMGTIVWQLNDCWPVTSWAAVDGYGRRKPLWHALRNANADRLLTVQPSPDGLVVVAVNDGPHPWQTTLEMSRRGVDGNLLDGASVPLVVGAQSRSEYRIPTEVAGATDPSREFLVMAAGGAASATYFFVEDRDLALQDPDLEVTVGPWADGVHRVTLRSRRLAKSVCLFVDRLHPEAWSEQSAVDVIPGFPIEFDVHSPVPLDTESVATQPVLRSLNDMVPARLSAFASPS